MSLSNDFRITKSGHILFRASAYPFILVSRKESMNILDWLDKEEAEGIDVS
jgi:hypothetical protein